MVIQRDQPIRIWGWATPGAVVRIWLGMEEQVGPVQADSTWLVMFRARAASTKPDTLTVQSGSQRLRLTDLWLGDVWLCAGQSNMAFPLASDQFARQTLHRAYNPMVRLFNQVPALTTYNQSYRPNELPHLQPDQFYQPAQWQVADSASARLFSAVGFYTGDRLQHELGIPIGLIHVAVGGSPAEAWMPATVADRQPVLDSLFRDDWLTNPLLETWCIQRAHQNLDSLIRSGYPVPRDSLGFNHPFKPGFLYDAALWPIRQLGLKGILWYQGESNALSLTRVRQHEQLFPQLVRAWRMTWQRTDLPIYTCQLSSIGTDRGYQSTYWPLFRDGQRRMADRLSHVGMAVTSDVGHPLDVHPTNKKTVGERLAREILVKTYGQHLALSPSISRVVRRKGQWVLRFTRTEKGLRTADAERVRGFSVGNADGPWQDVSVRLTRTSIRLAVGQVSTGAYLYYGWKPFSDGNVVNAEGLPLSTFRIPLP
jgi:sialate O-acetylesterase